MGVAVYNHLEKLIPKVDHPTIEMTLNMRTARGNSYGIFIHGNATWKLLEDNYDDWQLYMICHNPIDYLTWGIR